MSRALPLFLLPVLLSAADLVVKVEGPLGEPLHGAAVDLRREGEEPGRVRLTPRTGRDGRVRFPGLKAGVYHVQARRHQGWRGEAGRRVEIGRGPGSVETTLTTGRERSYRITGVVEQLDARGLTQPALFVDRVEQRTAATAYEPCRATMIQSDGTFRVRVRTPGEYRLYIGEALAGSRGCQRGAPAMAQTLFVAEDVSDLHLPAK